MAKFCGKCGAPLEAGDRFCMNCGEPVKTVDEELTVPLKSADKKEIPKEPKGSENAPDKKTGLAARAVRQSDNGQETSRNNQDSAKGNTGKIADASDDQRQRKKGDHRNNDHSTKDEMPQRNESQKTQVKPKTAPPKKNNKSIFIIVGVVVGLIAIGALIYCFATGILPPKTTVPISFKINIDDGFNKDSTPIVAKITDKSDKSKVTYTTFTTEDKNGKEIEMPQGQYEIEMISPINADGSIYDMGKTMSVDTATEEERNINTNCKRIAAGDVTSAQIKGIADALKEASGNESVDISESEINKATERVKTKQAEEEKQRKAAEKQAAIDNAIAQGYDQIVTGKILMLDDKESVNNYFPDNLKYYGDMSSSYRTPYVLLCFDTPQNISAMTSAGRVDTKQVSEICLSTDPESWRTYDRETVTVAINTRDGRWPSGLNPLWYTGRFSNNMFVWKD